MKKQKTISFWQKNGQRRGHCLWETCWQRRDGETCGVEAGGVDVQVRCVDQKMLLGEAAPRYCPPPPEQPGPGYSSLPEQSTPDYVLPSEQSTPDHVPPPSLVDVKQEVVIVEELEPLVGEQPPSPHSHDELDDDLVDDEDSILASHVAAKLRRLDPLQRIFAEKLIHDVLFEAQLGSLTRTARKIIEIDHEIKKLLYENEENEGVIIQDLKSTHAYNEKFHSLNNKVDGLNQYQVDAACSVSETGSAGRHHIRLPKLALVKYSGEVSQWIGWWAEFSSNDGDPELSNEEKFQYLLQVAIPKSKAGAINESFPPSRENYVKAICSLKGRFGHKVLLIQFYITELLKLVTDQEVKMLSVLNDKLESQLHSLEIFHIISDRNAAILFPLAESCLPLETLWHWEQTDHFFTTSDLANVNTAEKCPFCIGYHGSFCQKTVTMSHDEKRTLLTRAGCCFACAKRGHLAWRCRAKIQTIVSCLTKMILPADKENSDMKRLSTLQHFKRIVEFVEVRYQIGRYTSLNDSLEHGPNLIELLPDILLRFRDKIVGASADIAKAILQIAVYPEERDYLKFLWWTAILNYHLSRCMEECSPGDVERIEQLKSRFCMDKLATSMDNIGEAKKVQPLYTKITAQGGLNLRGWEFLGDTSVELTSIWGLKWNCKCDTLIALMSTDGRRFLMKNNYIKEYSIHNAEGLRSHRFRWTCDPEVETNAADSIETEEGEYMVKVVQSKSRVTQSKPVTIPQLKIMGATIGAQPILAWNDSSTVLAWIQHEEEWPIFVRNHIKGMRELTEGIEWWHISGCLNPADLPLRGCIIEHLVRSHLWEGPTWLYGREAEEDISFFLPCPRIIVGCTSISTNMNRLFELFNGYLHFKHNTLHKTEKLFRPLSVDELKYADGTVL
ncbi:hypothetical protein PR048_018832, partial [Dryococelus australis]